MESSNARCDAGACLLSKRAVYERSAQAVSDPLFCALIPTSLDERGNMCAPVCQLTRRLREGSPGQWQDRDCIQKQLNYSKTTVTKKTA